MLRLIVIVEVFVAQTQAEDPLLEQFGQRVLDAIGIVLVGETGGKAFDEAELDLGLAEHQRAGLGGEASALELREDFAGIEVLELEGCGITLRHSQGTSKLGIKCLPLRLLCQLGAPSEKSGLNHSQ